MSNHLTAPTSPAAGRPLPAATVSGVLHRLRWIGPTGIVVAVGLSALEWVLVTGQENNAGPIAATLALTMTLPVVLARRWPLAAAAACAVAAFVNGLLFADLVRCGGAFPAALYIAFVVGVFGRAGGRSWAGPVIGIGLVLVNLVAQMIFDRALNADGMAFVLFAVPLALGCWGLGLGVAALLARRTSR